MNATATSARTLLLLALVCLGAGTALFIQHRSRLELEGQNQALRQRLAESSHLQADNERLSNLVSRAAALPALPEAQLHELLRLRGEVGRLRQQSQEAAQLRAENQRLRAEAASRTTRSGNPAPPTAPAQAFPKESWAFTGYGTPEAAFQSAVWAVSRGDLKTFHASFTDEGRQKLVEEEKGKTEAELVQKGIESLGKFTSYRVEDREDRPDGSVLLRVSMIHPGGEPDTEKIILKRVGAEWRLAHD